MFSRNTTMMMMNKATDLVARLSTVGLEAIAQTLDDFLARATKNRWSPAQILEEVARLEEIHRTRRSLEGRLQRARIGRFKPLDDFDWNWPKKIDRDLIERALSLEFIREGRNLALIGSNGLGKTMLARNIAHQAVLAGFSVLCIGAGELIEDLRSCSPEALRRRLARYTRPHLLVIDEVGYLACDSHAADLLYKVVDRRYERLGKKELQSRSILITTNLAFREWNTVFPNATSIAALLDKLTHHADVTLLEGQSYRVHESQKEAAARRKKKV
jgi:DNA replication protein DnaC